MPKSTLFYRLLAAAIFPPIIKKTEPLVGLNYLPDAGGFILAANHVDWLDGFYLAAALWNARRTPVHFLAKTNNYWWTTVVVQIPPEEKRAIVSTAVIGLRDEKIVCNFPEGSRNPTGTLLPGKTGTVRMAIEAGVPVVPVGITCDYGQSMAQSIRWLWEDGHRITINFGPPLTFERSADDFSKERLESETERLMRAIAPLCHKKT